MAELAAAARTQLASLARAATQADLVPGIAGWERSMAELVRGAGARQQAAALYLLPHYQIIFRYILIVSICYAVVDQSPPGAEGRPLSMSP